MTLDGEVVPHDDPKNPFKVVFRSDTQVLAEWPVDSLETGQRRLQRALWAINHRETTMTSVEALAAEEMLGR